MLTLQRIVKKDTVKFTISTHELFFLNILALCALWAHRKYTASKYAKLAECLIQQHRFTESEEYYKWTSDALLMLDKTMAKASYTPLSSTDNDN